MNSLIALMIALSYLLHFDCLHSSKQSDFNEGLILHAVTKTPRRILYDNCYM